MIVSRKQYLKAKDLVVLQKTKTHYYVRSEKSQDWYSVTYDKRLNSFSCSCEDHMRRRNVCKHMIAVIQQYSKNITLEIKEEQPAA